MTCIVRQIVEITMNRSNSFHGQFASGENSAAVFEFVPCQSYGCSNDEYHCRDCVVGTKTPGPCASISELAGSYVLIWNLWFIYACIVHVYTGTIQAHMHLHWNAYAVHMSVCVCMVHICMYTPVYVCMCICYTYMHICIYLYISVLVWTYLYCMYMYESSQCLCWHAVDFRCIRV